MRALAAGLLVIALTSAACAGGNPNVTFYMSFSPDERVFAIDPEPYTTVNAFLFLGNVESGVSQMWFRISKVWEEYPGVISFPSYTGFKEWPGECDAGSIFEGKWVCSTSCEDEPEELFYSLSFFYYSGSCCIKLLEHPEYPRWVSDCSDPGELDYWCVESHASIGGAVCPDGDCEVNPVEDTTWGGIKALYK